MQNIFLPRRFIPPPGVGSTTGSRNEEVVGDKAITALAKTCSRLQRLNTTRSLCCVDLSVLKISQHPPYVPALHLSNRYRQRNQEWSPGTVCGAAEILARHPDTRAAVISWVRREHAQTAFGAEAKASLGNLRELQLLEPPRRAGDGDLLVSCMPQLEHLILDFEPCQIEGLLTLLINLPVGLRRMRCVCLNDCMEVQEAMWHRLPALPKFESLECSMHTVSQGACEFLRNCPALRRLHLISGTWGDVPFSPDVSMLIIALPPGLRSLFLSCPIESEFCGHRSLALKSGCFKKLRHLTELSLERFFFPDWAALQPVAQNLRNFKLSSPGSFPSVGALAVLRTMQSLREINIRWVQAVNDSVAAGIFVSPILQRARISECNISDYGMAVAIRSAACAASLRELDVFDNSGRYMLGDETALAIGKVLGRVERLCLFGAKASRVGVDSIKDGCPNVTNLYEDFRSRSFCPIDVAENDRGEWDEEMDGTDSDGGNEFRSDSSGD